MSDLVNGIKCPYCGHIDMDVKGVLFVQGGNNCFCAKCKKDFTVIINIEIVDVLDWD